MTPPKSICKKCYGDIKAKDKYDPTLDCKKCVGTDEKYFIQASQKCETCYGVHDIVAENDPSTADDNEYKCTPCIAQGANYYFDTTERKCKTCLNGTIDDDGKTCT